MLIKTRDRVEEIAPYVLGKSIEDIQQEYGLRVIRKMSENENVYGCSPRVKEMLPRFLEAIHHYPDGLAIELSTNVSEHLGVRVENLVFGNGSDEVIRLLTRAYISSGDEAIMAEVTFPRYKTNVFLEEGIPISVPLLNGAHHLERMLEHITDRTKMIFVCNPNNPTGTIVGKDELLRFIQQVPSHILVIIDEAYFEYVTTENYLDTISLLNEFPNLVVLRTFSKIYGLASLRIGYGVMNEEISIQLQKVKDVFNVNRLAQLAAIEALKDQLFIQQCAKKNKAGREYLEKALKEIGVPYFLSQSNFMMIKLPETGDRISHELLRRGIVVRSGTLLGFDSTIRVTVGTDIDNRHFVEELNHILHSK
ncbi:histidinol-phosphate transaminase [Bacillus spongiae]|uniref:Histidinol-phosphate aminotransferase n=1 Tax=Bacillus spongiae TaxID=2683610 RepID=A0ABU8HIQ6_9BACI